MKSDHKIFPRIGPIIIVILVLGIVILVSLMIAGYWYGWEWTGVNASIGPQVRQYQPGKTLWDWMQLIIIPVVLAIGALLFNFTLSKSEQKAAHLRAQTEHEIAVSNQQEDALQSYFDNMIELLLHEKLTNRK